MFSGGKDSLACLYLLEEHLDQITGLWVNTGKLFPEVLETINYHRKFFKHFIEVKVDRDKQWEKAGLPTELLSLDHTAYGHFYRHSDSGLKVQSSYQCCVENIMEPAWNVLTNIGCDLLIRGQKKSDFYKDKTFSGERLGGIKLFHPLENCTDSIVLEIIRQHMQMPWPDHLNYKHSSLDCMDCTGFLKFSSDKLALLKEKYPAVAKEVKQNLMKIQNAAGLELNLMRKEICKL